MDPMGPRATGRVGRADGAGRKGEEGGLGIGVCGQAGRVSNFGIGNNPRTFAVAVQNFAWGAVRGSQSSPTFNKQSNECTIFLI